MRPVERGDCPTDAAGKPITFAEYGYAKPHLTARVGEYCSFCEMPLGSGLAVEHIRHKYNNPGLECVWTNLLLACQSCNSCKGTKIDTQADVDACLWPHSHRTFDVFEYHHGVVKLAAIADGTIAARAQATEEMVRLTRRPGAGLTKEQIEKASDNRWKKRKEAWDAADVARNDLRQCDTPQMRRQILQSARATGFWSVWMTVFADEPEMQRLFCTEAFVGTAVGRVL